MKIKIGKLLLGNEEHQEKVKELTSKTLTMKKLVICVVLRTIVATYRPLSV